MTVSNKRSSNFALIAKCALHLCNCALIAKCALHLCNCVYTTFMVDIEFPTHVNNESQ